MKRIVILTSNELRHEYFRKVLANHSKISVLRSYCESSEKSLKNTIHQQEQNTLRIKHLSGRDSSEKEFFWDFCQNTTDKSNPVHIAKGEINEQIHVQEIIDLKPDMIISYGCSIIKSSLIEIFNKRFINIHLGLSPYYRGSGTNYFPFVNNELQFIGVTYMYIDKGIDTGEIIHQMRADVQRGDDVHKVGNRLIKDMANETAKLITNFEKIQPLSVEFPAQPRRYYKNSDFTNESLVQIYDNLQNGMIEQYLNHQNHLHLNNPIITQPF